MQSVTSERNSYDAYGPINRTQTDSAFSRTMSSKEGRKSQTSGSVGMDFSQGRENEDVVNDMDLDSVNPNSLLHYNRQSA